MWNCLRKHALRIYSGINRRSRVLHPGPRILSSATWPCRKSNRLTNQSINQSLDMYLKTTYLRIYLQYDHVSRLHTCICLDRAGICRREKAAHPFRRRCYRLCLSFGCNPRLLLAGYKGYQPMTSYLNDRRSDDSFHSFSTTTFPLYVSVIFKMC